MVGHLGNYTYTYKPYLNREKEIIPVYLDKNFGEADKIEIGNALNQWNYVLNGNAAFKIVDKSYDINNYFANKKQPGLFIIEITSHYPLIPPSMQGSQTLAFARVGDNCLYLIRDRLDNSDISFIVLHEVGHVLGSHHTDDGLMSPFFNKEKYQCVDLSALPSIAKRHHWSLESLNYCR